MKKLITTILTSIILTAAVNALPGFTSFIPDAAGEYVYYRDNSFERESYIGILCYDESTYEIKYLSPKNTEKAEQKKELALLIKVNPESDFFDMTGERIMYSVDYNSDDVDILNYLHDFLYEFSSRRIAKESVTTRQEEVSQDFDLFGGKVTFIYDCTIPLFNVRTILDQEQKKILDCCTIGQITSSEDTSFEDFNGINSEPLLVPATKAKNKAKSAKFSFNNQQIVLDEKWTQPMENMWTLGEDSIVTLSEIPYVSEEKDLNESFIIRKLMESTQGRYIDFSNAEIIYNKKNGQYKMTALSYTKEGSNTIRTVKILTPLAEPSSKFSYFSISTYSTAYQKNTAYFDKIVNQYRVK